MVQHLGTVIEIHLFVRTLLVVEDYDVVICHFNNIWLSLNRSIIDTILIIIFINIVVLNIWLQVVKQLIRGDHIALL